MSDQLGPNDYKLALASQSACNLTGIVIAFAQVLPKIWAEVRAEGGGTDQVNTHPISILYAAQISFLAGAASMTRHNLSWDDAHRFCTKRAEGGIPA